MPKHVGVTRTNG